MRAIRLLVPLLICFVCVNLNSTKVDSVLKDQQDLEVILKKSAEYCEKVKNSALYFVCLEKITETIFHYGSEEGKEIVLDRYWARRYRGSRRNPRPIKNVFLYDYQLIKKGMEIEESRTLLEENGEKQNEKNAELKTKRFYSQMSVFGPVSLLSDEWQALYNYKLLKEERINRRKAYVIEVTPKHKIIEKPNYGKVWVDKQDYSILKIDVQEESLAGYDEIKEELKKYKITPIITDVHSYFTMKNGIRFPSKTIIDENYRGPFLGGKLKKSITVIKYDNYKFFTVETEVKH